MTSYSAKGTFTDFNESFLELVNFKTSSFSYP